MPVRKQRTILLLGAGGQLGQDVQAVWPAELPEDHLVPLTHAQLDIADGEGVRSVVRESGAALVLNCAAYNRVDAAEDEVGAALTANATGAALVADACAAAGAEMIHVSTDYVFSGRGRNLGQPYVETDPIEPLSAYGISKAAGEMFVQARLPRSYVVRVSGLYGVAGSAGKGGNFVTAVLARAAAGETVRVVDDQVLTPTPTVAVARQLAALSMTGGHGTYHATCQGECSWYEFAAAIFELTGRIVRLEPQSTAESRRRAHRPSYSALDNHNLRAAGIDLRPPWREALARYLRAAGLGA